MKKLTLTLLAGCMSFAVMGAYAAQGSPADTDKAGRTAPGTASGEMGAADPTPGKAGPGTTKGRAKGATSSTAGTGAAAGDTGGTSAAASTGGDAPKGRRNRRAARASRG